MKKQAWHTLYWVIGLFLLAFSFICLLQPIPVLLLGVGAFLFFGSRFFRFRDGQSLIHCFYGLFISTFLLVGGFALIYAQKGLLSSQGQELDWYDYIYFSLVTFTTLGYGDITPTKAARLWAAAEAVLGYIFLGIFVSLLFYLLSQKQGREESSE